MKFSIESLLRVPGIVLWLMVLVLGAVALAGCSGEAAPGAAMPPPPAVSVAPVLVKEVARWDEFTGRVEAVETVELKPRVSGYIERVNFTEGQEVAAGDVLFVIDQRPYRAAFNRAAANLARARARAGLAETEAARAQKLADQHAISTEELDQREAAMAQAKADVDAAEAAVEIAQLDLEFTKVRAPIDGRAGRALVTAGNLVATQPNATLLTTIVSLDPVYVYFDTDEQTYLRYNQLARSGRRPSSRAGSIPVRVGLADDEGYPYSGTVDFMNNRVDPETGTIRVRAVLDNADRVFTPGLFARVKVLGSGRFEAMLIDEKAVLTDQDRKYVYVLGPENRAVRKDIVPGEMIEGLRVVRNGLKHSDRVIVHGVQKVFVPGMPVNAQEIAMGDPPAPAPIKTAAAGN